MISVQEALDLVVANAGRQEISPMFAQNALGQVLAEDVLADVDSPPFDKSMMDGFAVRSGDVTAGMPLKVIGEIRAGNTEAITIGEGECAAIMTGAPIPQGADSVVVIEKCKVLDAMMTTELESCQPGLNVLTRGFEFKKDEVVLKRGRPIMPAEIGVLATVGCIPKTFRPPTIGIIASGDELLDAPGYTVRTAAAGDANDKRTSPLSHGRIRNSNTPTLEALCAAHGIEATSYPIAPDDPKKLAELLQSGLSNDVLLITGGVSMGTADFIPRVLSQRCNEVFHKVALKPGMPVWFGTHDKGLVFGLPGNPVSVLCCFELFVTTALRARQGWADPYPKFFNAKLAADFTYPTKRETYHPAKLTFTDDGPVVSPVPWFGSADVLGASRADALAVLPVGPGNHKTDDRLRVLPLSKPGWIWTCNGVGGAS